MNEQWTIQQNVATFILHSRFLGFVDKLGTAYKDPIIATGYGSMIAMPLMRNTWKTDMSEAEARKLVEDSIRLMFYRDARAFHKVITVQARLIPNSSNVNIPFLVLLVSSWSCKWRGMQN